ncbi:HIT-like domain-containing protein [Dipodascopsis tothii]|uniref:HIT-like domain-containing protein n=1 Tax=Dipodascopsis tothii TaxID=44089 RepID=UPI0034CEAA0A
MFPQLPADFASVVETTFKNAVASGDLIFSESERSVLKYDGYTMEVRMAPALGQKPKSAPKPDGEGAKKFNPFFPPDPKLVLGGLGDKHTLVLNKFAIVPHHFLCVTKAEESQEAPITIEDLRATWAALQEPIGTSDRTLAFFNKGKNSGASQAHKHIQFLPLDKGTELFPDKVVARTPYEAPSERDPVGQRPLKHSAIPFEHFILPLPTDPSDEELMMRFWALYHRTLQALKQNDNWEKSFNWAMTKEWVIMVPRRADEFEGISVNGTGVVGLLLAKSAAQLAQITELTAGRVLTEVGFPVGPNTEAHYDY